MNAPDTSPRWDWSSWQIDATRRAPRTAAREGTPGLGGVDPNRRCRKKGLYMLLYDHSDCARFWTYSHEVCQPIATNIKNPPPKEIGGGPAGIPSRRFALEIRSGRFDPRPFTPPQGRHASPGNRGLPDVLFHRGFDSPPGHHGDEVRPVVGLGMQVRVETFLRHGDVRHRLGRELRGERFFHRRHAEYARTGAGHRDAHVRAEVGDEHTDDGVA